MKTPDCCETMERELLAWKSLLFDICRKLDILSGSPKERHFPEYEDINLLIKEMDERIELIRETTSSKMELADFSSESAFFKRSMANIRVDPNEAIRILGPGNFGG